MDTKSVPIEDLARARTFYELVMGLTPMMEADSWVEYGLADQYIFALAGSKRPIPRSTAG